MEGRVEEVEEQESPVTWDQAIDWILTLIKHPLIHNAMCLCMSVCVVCFIYEYEYMQEDYNFLWVMLVVYKVKEAMKK